MKEATGEGSMTIVTIVIIAAIVAAAALVIGMMMRSAKSTADTTGQGYNEDDPTQNLIIDEMNGENEE